MYVILRAGLQGKVVYNETKNFNWKSRCGGHGGEMQPPENLSTQSTSYGYVSNVNSSATTA